ncbi:hypothetical protein CFP56_016104 [Quercus suber]|uniref:Uncharacterized protein n=1 Tax=Quercus suber TaxID=58331 RepID=A0AAW0KP02_QUESU
MHKPLIAASTFFGSLHLLFTNAVDASLESECLVPMKELHIRLCLDGGAECMTVEGLRSAVVSLQSLTDQWVSIRSARSSTDGAKWTNSMSPERVTETIQSNKQQSVTDHSLQFASCTSLPVTQSLKEKVNDSEKAFNANNYQQSPSLAVSSFIILNIQSDPTLLCQFRWPSNIHLLRLDFDAFHFDTLVPLE